MSYPGGIDKDITAVEADRYRSWGLNVFIFWENAVEDALGGRSSGRAMAAYARDQVTARGGPADGGVIYFCVDFDATQAQIQGPVLDWFRGIRDVLPLRQVGVYGGYYPVKAVLDAGLAAYACQTRAWSGSLWDPRAQLQQYSWTTLNDGSQVDLLRVMNPSFGQWVDTDTPEVDMPLTDDEFKRIRAEVGAVVDARLVRVLRYLVTGQRNSLVGPHYDIPASDRFPGGADAYAWTADPAIAAATLDELADTLADIVAKLDTITVVNTLTVTDPVALRQALADAIAGLTATTTLAQEPPA